MLPNHHTYFQSNMITLQLQPCSQFSSFSHLHQMQYKCLKKWLSKITHVSSHYNVWFKADTDKKLSSLFLVVSENAVCLLQPCSGAVLNSWLHISYGGGEIPHVNGVKHEHWTDCNKKHENLQHTLHDWGQNSTEQMYYYCCDFTLTAKHAVLAVIVKSG
jgi:hypothetical protein